MALFTTICFTFSLVVIYHCFYQLYTQFKKFELEQKELNEQTFKLIEKMSDNMKSMNDEILLHRKTLMAVEAHLVSQYDPTDDDKKNWN